MKYLKQISLILLFSFVGELCRFLIPLNIPASIYGILLLFLALSLKLIRVEAVRETGGFLTSMLPVLFVAPAVRLMDYWPDVRPVLIPFVLISLVVTLLVFALSGMVTQRLIRKEKQKNA
ncbi:MAG: CidA/LrgA family protein [Oscillospiraceae bacterium]|nr:CidA/LrgA family protein [Oscillospiraceae bacterium]